jgi:hypothetical protein
MLKNILKLEGVKALSSEQKKSINGSGLMCRTRNGCIKYAPFCTERECRIILE